MIQNNLKGIRVQVDAVVRLQPAILEPKSLFMEPLDEILESLRKYRKLVAAHARNNVYRISNSATR